MVVDQVVKRFTVPVHSLDHLVQWSDERKWSDGKAGAREKEVRWPDWSSGRAVRQVDRHCSVFGVV